MELLKVASGGYRRVRGTYTDPKIFEYWYEQEEFLFVDLTLAELYRRLGRTTRPTRCCAGSSTSPRPTTTSFPEMYVPSLRAFPGKIGDPTGAIPMVGYGAGAYVLHLLERHGGGK